MRNLPPIIMHGRRLTRRDRLKVGGELRDLLDTGLGKPADLIFHDCWLDDEPDGRVASCWGQKGSRAFHVELIEKPTWVSLADLDAEDQP
jgi:hypothetical protein